MIGFFDYTVWLTYLSLLSATAGIMISLNNQAHPYIGVFFLMICGLCDAFDGRVARTKANRTKTEKNYGIQIDSLSDLVAFGILPACVGNAMIRVLPSVTDVTKLHAERILSQPYYFICHGILLFYALAALIRLAYYNVTEEERQATEGGCRKYFEGLPVTSSALIFPTVLLFQYILPTDITPIYFVVMLITGICFITRFKVPKPGLKGILAMVGFGAIEFIILAITWFSRMKL